MFNVDFNSVLEELGADFMLRIINAARQSSEYTLMRFLPERRMTSYTVKDGSIRIVPTMAGLSGMDSPYPPTGRIETSKFLAETGKIANEMTLTEQVLREMQEVMIRNAASGNPNKQYLARVIANFADAVLMQSHMDTMEWLRGQALTSGQIQWEYNNLSLDINYQLNPDHLFETRTVASGTHYAGADSGYWADRRRAHKLLGGQITGEVMHIDTFYQIVDGSDREKIEVLEENGNSFRIRRLIGNNDRPASDTRETARITTYSLEGEVVDPADQTTTTKRPFFPRGKVLFVGPTSRRGFDIANVGEGSQMEDMHELGYTHIAPTTEGQGQLGRWMRVYTPERFPMQLKGEGVTNGLPVIHDDESFCVASTEMVDA